VEKWITFSSGLTLNFAREWGKLVIEILLCFKQYMMNEWMNEWCPSTWCPSGIMDSRTVTNCWKMTHMGQPATWGLVVSSLIHLGHRWWNQVFSVLSQSKWQSSTLKFPLLSIAKKFGQDYLFDWQGIVHCKFMYSRELTSKGTRRC